ncbi:MAG: AAA family ATPase [Desulfomonilaceae bacterium]
MTNLSNTKILKPDLEQARTFLKLLGRGSFTFQTFDDDPERKDPNLVFVRHGSLNQHADGLIRVNNEGAGIYFMVNKGDLKARKAENVTDVRAVFVDLDGSPIEPITACEPRPHMILETSPGRYHAYWLTKDVALDEFAGIQTALAAKFQGDPSVKDLPRVMRLAGFWHRKGQPFLTRIVDKLPPVPYTKEQIITGLQLNLTADAPATSDKDSKIQTAQEIPKGSRNTSLTSIAGAMRQKIGLEPDAILAALSVINQTRCAQPLPDREIESIVHSISRYPIGNLRAAENKIIIPTGITFEELMKKDLPEPKWIIRDLLPEGLCLLAGTPKIGKSWLAQHLSLSVASGRSALAHFSCDQGDVLHFALEDTQRRFKKRMATMLEGSDAPVLASLYNTCPPLSDKQPDGLDFIHKWLDEHQSAKLIVIDTLAKIRPHKRGHEPLYDRDYRDLEGLQQLAGQYAVAIIVITHTNQGEHRDVLNTVSGTSGLTGAADTIWILEKTARGESNGTLFISGRDIEERTGAMKFDNTTGLWRWIGDAVELNMSKERLEIRDVVQTAEAPLGIKEMAGILRKPYSVINKRVQRMLEKGEIERAAGSRGKYKLPAEDQRYEEISQPDHHEGHGYHAHT